MKTSIKIFLSCCLLVVLLLSLRPVPKATFENCTAIVGKVTDIQEGVGENDIILSLANNQGYYYINRGLEKGLNLSEIQDQLLNNEITLHCINHWTPLAGNTTKHIARIEWNGTIIYNEIDA